MTATDPTPTPARRRLLTRCCGALALLLACSAEKPPTADAKTEAPQEVGAEAQAVPPAEQLPDAAALLDDVVAARGGAEQFAAMKTYYSETEIDAAALGLSGSGKTWWRDGDFYGEMFIPGSGETRMGGQGGAFWMQDPTHGLRRVVGAEAEQISWSTSVCLACEWRRYFKEAKTTKVHAVNAGEVAEIALTSAQGDVVTLVVDMATKLPTAQRYNQQTPFGAIPVEVRFHDYRDVDGLKISFRQELKTSVSLLTSTTTRFDINAEVDATRFAMPGSDRVVNLDDKASIEAADAKQSSL